MAQGSVPFHLKSSRSCLWCVCLHGIREPTELKHHPCLMHEGMHKGKSNDVVGLRPSILVPLLSLGSLLFESREHECGIYGDGVEIFEVGILRVDALQEVRIHKAIGPESMEMLGIMPHQGVPRRPCRGTSA